MGPNTKTDRVTNSRQQSDIDFDTDSELVARESVADKNVSMVAEDIVGFRYQAATENSQHSEKFSNVLQ